MPRRKKPVVLEDEAPEKSLRPDRASPSRRNDPRRARAHLQAFREKYGTAKEITDVNAIPTWVFNALVRHEWLDMTWAEALREDFGEKRAKKKWAMLARYRKSPAFQQLAETVKSWPRDRVQEQVAEIIAANALKVTMTNLKVMRLAEESGAIGELAKQSRWMAENYGMTQPKKSESAPTHISITLNGGTITAEIPMGESEAQKVLPAEIVEE